ncbi:MAG: FAD-binding oxidoreductase [Alphaproteobacteria bacterium]|nr:FAD-binding oxidoreductase [Alphaproteobacteria bacterium]
MSETYDAVVVGAGISGTATAYHLKKFGMKRVLLIDREAGVAHGPTRESAAVVRMHYSEPVLVRMAMESRDMFKNMRVLLGKDGGFKEKGWFIALPPSMMEAAQRNIDMQRHLGLKTGFLSEREIADKAPWLNTDGVGGVIYEPESGYADPVQTTEAFHHAYADLGGESRFRTPCRSLVRSGDRIAGIVLDNGSISAGFTVNAAGPWSKYLAATAGLELQLRAVREQDAIWQVRPNRPMPECSFSTAIEAAYCRALGDRRFILGLGYPKPYHDVDPYNYKRTMDDDFRMVAFEKNVKRVPNLEGAKFLDAYASLYDITPDFYPFVGPRAGLAGYADYCGGSGHGFKIAPAIGKHLAQWIVDGRTGHEFAGLSYDRLAKGSLYGGLGGNRG